MTDGLVEANPCRCGGTGTECSVECRIVGPELVLELADTMTTHNFVAMVLLAALRRPTPWPSS